MYNVVSNLVEAYWPGGYRIGFVTTNDVQSVINTVPEGQVGVVKTHRAIAGIQDVLASGMAKVVCSYRDPRDVLAADKVYTRMVGHSHYSGYAEGLVDVLYQCTQSQSFFVDQVVAQNPNVSLWRYEDVMANGLHWYINEMAQRLGIPADIKFINELADKMDFSKLETYCASLENVDIGTCLHPHHLLGGGVGIWRAELSMVEKSAMNMLFGFWLRKNKYLMVD